MPTIEAQLQQAGLAMVGYCNALTSGAMQLEDVRCTISRPDATIVAASYFRVIAPLTLMGDEHALCASMPHENARIVGRPRLQRTLEIR